MGRGINCSVVAGEMYQRCLAMGTLHRHGFQLQVDVSKEYYLEVDHQAPRARRAREGLEQGQEPS